MFIVEVRDLMRGHSTDTVNRGLGLYAYGVSMQAFTFTFMHLADAFIQSDLHCIQVTVLHFISSCFPWESNPWSWRCWHHALPFELQESYRLILYNDLHMGECIYEHLCSCENAHASNHTYWDRISLPKKLVFKKFPKTSALGLKYWIQIPAAQKRRGAHLVTLVWIKK